MTSRVTDHTKQFSRVARRRQVSLIVLGGQPVSFSVAVTRWGCRIRFRSGSQAHLMTALAAMGGIIEHPFPQEVERTAPEGSPLDHF